MQNLLKLEFRKLKKQLVFYICLGASISMIVMSLISTNFMSSMLGMAVEYTNIDALVSAMSGSSFYTVCAVFIAVNVCEDYGQKTVKNFYARGYTRGQVTGAKMIVVFAATTILFLAVEIASFLFGTLLFGFADNAGTHFLSVIGTQYVSAMAYVAFFFAISIILQKIGGGIAVSIFGTTAIHLILSLIDILADFETLRLSDYWLEGIAGSLTTTAVSGDRLVACLITSLIYIPLFLFLGHTLSKKREI